MSFRDFLVTALVFGAIPFIFKRPYIGIVVWSWLSYMNPHRLTWGFAYSMPFAQITALVTMLAYVLSTDPNKKSPIPRNALTVTWTLFLFWICLTTIFAIYFDFALIQLEKIAKIQLITILTILLINDRVKLEHLIWIIVVSIGYYTVKGGVFTIQTAGDFRVWGPAGSFIEDNNALAVAGVMIIPLMVYLRSTLTSRWARLAMLAAICLTAVSAAGSYSRSAFVAGACVSIFLMWKSPQRVSLFAGLILLLPLIFTFMPQAWHDRMATITNPTEEGSANNRLESWATAINIANNRPLGGGLDLWSREVYATYGPAWINRNAVRNAHSVYFNILAEHGWIGLILFVTIFYLAWRQANWVIRNTRGAPDNRDFQWANNLARMLQISLVAYASGGATLTLAYFDLPWHIVAITIILRRHIEARSQPASSNRTHHALAPAHAAYPAERQMYRDSRTK